MSAISSQPGLFDLVQGTDPAQSALARARMRAMIDRLVATEQPPWKDEMAVILDDGAFQRAMRLVPAAEAQALWAAFDRETERLYALRPWGETAPDRQPG